MNIYISLKQIRQNSLETLTHVNYFLVCPEFSPQNLYINPVLI